MVPNKEARGEYSSVCYPGKDDGECGSSTATTTTTTTRDDDTVLGEKSQLSTRVNDDENKPPVTTEYVLHVAFFSFIAFLLFEAVFALIAHSQAMLADAEAMSVDALTYLFNLCAERIKNRPLQPWEIDLPEEVCNYKRKLQCLYLELAPPSISLFALVAVTVVTLSDAFSTLFRQGDDSVEDDGDVSVSIMFFFSAANLLLDIVNITFFARAGAVFGLDVVQKENLQPEWRKRFRSNASLVVDERTALLAGAGEVELGKREYTDDEDSDDGASNDTFVPCERSKVLVNLNMCSAWTHVCADTMRSATVLIAASVAFVVPSLEGATADSAAAIAVSVIILFSLLPLLQGLVLTLVEIIALHRNPPCAMLCSKGY